MNLYYIEKYYNKFYKYDYYFLYAKSVYHILIIIFTLILGITIKTKTLFLFNLNDGQLQITNFTLDIFNPRVLGMIFFIMLFDFIFLYIIKNEIFNLEKIYNKEYWFRLNTKRILLCEIFIFIFTMSHPLARHIMYFMTFNTIEIFLLYKVIKYIPFGKFIVLTITYISIIQLLLYPVFEFMKLKSTFG